MARPALTRYGCNAQMMLRSICRLPVLGLDNRCLVFRTGSLMYICLCNGLTDRDLREHRAGEACSVAMVYRALGVQPQCGKCVPFVRRMLQVAEPTLYHQPPPRQPDISLLS